MLTCLVKYNLEKSCKHELSLAMQNLSKLGNVKVNKRTSKQMYLNVWEFSLIIGQLNISQTKNGAESLQSGIFPCSELVCQLKLGEGQ